MTAVVTVDGVDDMGYFRFFRRTKIGRGLSLNLSKSGPSLSVGPRGAKVTVGPRGVRRTVGVPGTGLYYTSTSRGSGRRREASGNAGLGLLLLLVIVLVIVVAFWQVLVLIAIGALGLGLIWWALRRDQADTAHPVDPASALTELDDLHRAGVLTDAEYEQKKAAIGVVL